MQPNPTYTLFPLGDNAILIDFGNELNEGINKKLLSIFEKIKDQHLPGVLDVVPAYSSLTIHYDVMKILEKAGSKPVFDFITNQVKKIIDEVKDISFEENRKISIPVCYDEEFGLDLSFLANKKNLNIEDVIQLHTAKSYRVYMIGFLPGFAYMGEVDEKIQIPRKENPRTNVEAGSVGIAGSQTGIYPLQSPGGWQIIGRTPLQIFDKGKTEPVLLQPGDEIKFFSINRDEFRNYEGGHS
ncbi:MAG TPA: 5-oxoprolinase subunit PxpB [Chitinophagaceae bacterium]|nr:5-oxoprolinase subunit PxpB [Chitinophagaceae bacterium]